MENRQSRKLRVMVDANVLVAATYSPRFPYEVLQHALQGDCKLVLSERIVQEAREAVKEIVPKRLSIFEEFLERVDYEITAVPTDEENAVRADLVRDPKDVHVALAAINAQVDYLVTQDKDFTAPEEPIHQHLKVLLPGTFLREHMSWTSEALEAIRKRTWDELD